VITGEDSEKVAEAEAKKKAETEALAAKEGKEKEDATPNPIVALGRCKEAIEAQVERVQAKVAEVSEKAQAKYNETKAKIDEMSKGPKKVVSADDGVIAVGEAPTSVQLRLRTMYRKSVEYRLAHALFETKFRKMRISLAFVHLLLSTVTGAVLFLGLAAWITGGLSFVLTGLNSFMQAVNLAELEAGHTEGRLVFAGLQRSFATILMLNDRAGVLEKFPTCAVKFHEAEKRTAKTPGIHHFKNPSGGQMFFLITEEVSDRNEARAFGDMPKRHSARLIRMLHMP